MLSEYPTNSLTSVEQFANPRMPVASTIILDATQLVADDAASATTLKSTMLKLQKRASYLSTNDTGDQDIATIKELVAKIKHKMIKRGQEANANVDSALQQIAAMASGARSSNMVQGEVMSAAGAGVDVEKPAESEESESEESENAEQADLPFPYAVGLPDDTVQDLLDVIDLNTNGNPFRACGPDWMPEDSSEQVDHGRPFEGRGDCKAQ